VTTIAKYPSGKPGATVASGTDVVKTTTAPKRILIIEDNLDSVRIFALLLRDMGHTVEYAINGYAGLEAARRFRPQIILLDLGLPGIDGFEVCSQIKRDPKLQHIRVIVVTALTQEEHRIRCEAVGCDLYLVKPVPVFVLEDALG
jgi:CheY-like chemotaxis protein